VRGSDKLLMLQFETWGETLNQMRECWMGLKIHPLKNLLFSRCRTESLGISKNMYYARAVGYREEHERFFGRVAKLIEKEY